MINPTNATSNGTMGLNGNGIYNGTSHWNSIDANRTLGTNGTNDLNLTSLLDNNHSNSHFRGKEDAKVLSYFIPDSISRVFHPQQGGHIVIANLVMYAMAARNAALLNLPVAPQNATSTDQSCPLPPSPACDGTSTDTWTARDAAVSAVTQFCNKSVNNLGSAGKVTSGTFNPNSLDHMSISIKWDDDYAIGQGECNMWFDSLIDSCDVPNGNSNPLNLKHGGSIGFATNATLSIEPLVVRQEWNKGRATAHQCNGINNNNYIDQATLAGNIQAYCQSSASKILANASSTFTQDFNANTPDHVTLTTKWPAGPLSFQIFQDECNYYMSTIMDGCDVPSVSTNVMNFKHGGSMKDNNGISYQIVPNVARAPAPAQAIGNCNSWWKPVWQTFDVYGGGWADSDFGKSLQKQIQGCGLMSKWKFQYFDEPHPDGTEWHASGRLPIWTRKCVGRAITSAGGFTGGCKGNG
ncbi:MAG: hypothetical protein M1819_006295 [Sarea resinae]|nr:MAG: hypothetical protein M1819_006295 [Sarea resinae]